MQRKRLAIMFTDIAGYTAMMAADESHALKILGKSRNIHTKAIGRWHGTLIKEMGDGILATFASAIDAVSCSLQIQEKASDLGAKIRIGIHYAPITLDRGDVFGDGVNIASRIESIADPGGIYISAPVVDSVQKEDRTLLQTVYLGQIPLKNVPRPVPVHAIVNGNIKPPKDQKIQELTQKDRLTSIAVLPFKSLGDTPEQQYLVDGMQDALISELAQIESLRVISRTSTLRYRDTTKSMQVIANELQVDGLIEATILEAKKVAHMQVQLIKAFPNEEHLWAGSYHKDMKDVFALYSEVVRDVTTNTRSKVTSHEKKHLENPAVVVPQSYKSYLKGMFYWEKLSRKDLDQAYEYFDHAIELDPKFAPAYAGKAGIWMGRMIMGYDSSTRAIPSIYSNIRKTRKLDEDNVDSHFWNALLSVWAEWDWTDGYNEFEEVEKLNNNHALSAAYFSHLLLYTGDIEKSDFQAEKAIRLDPFNDLVQSLYAMQLHYRRRYRDAIQVLHQILSEKESHPIALSTLRSVYHNMGHFEDAYQVFRKSYIERGDHEEAEVLEKAYKSSGYSAALTAVAESMISRSDQKAWQIATLFARAGDKNRALDYLEKSLEIRDPNMPYMAVDPIFDELKGEVRFKEMLDELNLFL